MKKVSIIFKGKVNVPTGVAYVLRLLINHESLFLQKNLLLQLFAIDDYTNINKSISYSEQTSPVLKNKITTLATKYYFSTVLLMNRLSDYHAKNIVKKYNAKHDNAEILMFHDITTAFYYLKFKKSSDKKKYVLVLHSDGTATKMLYERFPAIKGKKYEKKLIKRFEYTIRMMDRIVFVSEKSKQTFLDNYGSMIKNENVFCIHNGIPDYDYADKTIKTPNKVIKLINVSSVSLRKGQDLLIEGFRNLSQEEKNAFEINIVGSGEKLKEYMHLTKKYGITNIHFLGIRRDIPELLYHSDAFIMTSKEEGLPIAILEAMRAGLPVIATNVGGISEMVSNNNGYLIKPEINEITDALKTIFLEKEKLPAKSITSKLTFKKNFSSEKMMEKYASLLMNL